MQDALGPVDIYGCGAGVAPLATGPRAGSDHIDLVAGLYAFHQIAGLTLLLSRNRQGIGACSDA